MPLLKRKPLQKANTQERLKDNDEVFVCETTGELFSDYDDFFNRIMLLSSTVWSCAMTGRINLTYADALESEKAAKRTLKSFPAALKGPILLIASRTMRTSIHELASDVHGYAKDVFFKGETVYTRTGDPETLRKGKIVRVGISEPPSDHQNDPSRLSYCIVSSDGESPTSYTVRGDAVTRERTCLSREKCKLFLKQHVELGPDQVLCVKKASLEQFVTSKGCTDDKVFYGQKPDFGVSKKLLAKEKASGKEAGKKKGESGTGEKKAPLPPAKEAKPKEKKGKAAKGTADGKKQQTIAKYIQATAEERETLMKKKLDEKNARAEEKAQQKALAKEREAAEKTVLLTYVEVALKQLNSEGEDQQLVDQRVLPPARPVRTAIGEEHFSNFVFILEFLNQFGDILSIEERFPKGVTMETLERALLDRTMHGPLTDLLQVLLCQLFTALAENRYDKATRVCNKQFSTKLSDLPMDSTTVTELLRLYLAPYSQPSCLGEPCHSLLRDQPQLMRTLATHSIFDLPTNTVMQIVCTLIHQVLQTDEEVQARVEKVGEARMKLANNQLERHRLPQKTETLKRVAKRAMNQEVSSLLLDDRPGEQWDSAKMAEGRKMLQQKLDEELQRIDAEASERLTELLDEYESLKSNYGHFQVYLGADRGYRYYWQFQSLPGLFVEHDGTLAESCPGRVTINIPRLAQCERNMRKRCITDAILKCAGHSNGLLEGNGTESERPMKDVYEQLLIRGIALLEKSEQRKKNPFAVAKDDSGVKDTDAAKMETDAPENSVPPPVPPTNRELLMCTGDKEDCPVHASRQHSTWSYYATAEELDALIESLNMHGVREKALRLTLEQCRDELKEHMKKCPIKSLSIRDSAEHPPVRSTRQANALTGQREVPANDTLEDKFRSCLIEMEGRISAGCLGELKVNSIEKWRNAILNRSYDAQVSGELVWGHKRMNGIRYEKVNSDDDSDDSGVEETDEPDDSDADNLEPLAQTDTDDKTLLETVHSLASALIQVAQSIDPKFLRYPFGPNARCKDRSMIAQLVAIGQRKLLRWEDSLMRSTSFAQLFLHYHVLYDALCWSRSIERAVCMVCRRKGDANLTLLCDECNRACHMYCLKPKLKKVPQGDWFCKVCRPADHETPQRNGRKRTKIIEDLELDSEDDAQAENSNESDVEIIEEEEEEEEDKDEDEREEEDEDEESVHSSEEEEEEQTKIVFKKALRNQKRKNEQPKQKVSKKDDRNARAAARKQESVARKSSGNHPAKRSRLSDASESSRVKREPIVERSTRSSGGGRRSSRLSGRGDC